MLRNFRIATGSNAASLVISGYDDEGISIDIIIIIMSSPLLSLSRAAAAAAAPPLIEPDGRDIAPVEESIPNVMKPIPVILPIQRPPLVQNFSAKIIGANNPIQ